jgi:hypothetical protein
MSFSAGSPLPEHRIKASIEPRDFNNRIQDNDYAQHHGFRAGLVSGTSVYAYMSRPITELLGREWLERGSADMRFLPPLYEGEDLRLGGNIDAIKEDGALILNCQAANSQGVVCGNGTAQLPSAVPSPEPSTESYPAARGKLHRPISLELLEPGETLVPVSSEFTWNIHWQYCRKAIRDLHPLYEKAMHPGWLACRASQILAENYAVQAWIDVSCNVQHFHWQEEECLIETRGRVLNRFEQKGDHFVELDLGIFSPARCLATIRYTAIFRIAPNAA